MKENVIFLLRVVELVTLGPIITDSIGKYLAIMIET